MMSSAHPLPIPNHFDPAQVGTVWRVPYEVRSQQATAWAKQHTISPSAADPQRICLLAIDVQNTFCLPDFELFVAGRSGCGAIEDTTRLCEFVYRNLNVLTTIIPTMDTHTAAQIFHAVFWVDAEGNHPPAMTLISLADVESERWSANPTLAPSLCTTPEQLQTYALHYVRQLEQQGKYLLTVWPYHSMLGGIGHALVPAFEEACFFHAIARSSPTQFELKGSNPLTENYSVLKPEVITNHHQQPIDRKNQALIQTLIDFDALIVAGQAKSHCVAWTVSDLLSEVQQIDPSLAQKVYLLEDCTSPVVVPGVVDFTDDAEAAYAGFEKAGMHRVLSTDPTWLAALRS